MEPVADGEYVVVYFHTKTQRDNIPSYWWIKQIYSTLPYKYKKNLKVSLSGVSGGQREKRRQAPYLRNSGYVFIYLELHTEFNHIV